VTTPLQSPPRACSRILCPGENQRRNKPGSPPRYRLYKPRMLFRIAQRLPNFVSDCTERVNEIHRGPGALKPRLQLLPVHNLVVMFPHNAQHLKWLSL
jgi:hypothetical protein